MPSHFLKSVIFGFAIALFGASPAALASEISSVPSNVPGTAKTVFLEEKPELVESVSTVRMGLSKVENTDASIVTASLDQIGPDETKTVVISTSRKDVLQRVQAWLAKHPKAPKILFIPLGDLVKKVPETQLARSIVATANYDLGKAAGAFKERVTDALFTDKFGFFTVMLSLGIDSVIWMHADNMSTFQKSSMVVFNVFVNLYFADKDAWPKLGHRVQNWFTKQLSKVGVVVANDDKAAGVSRLSMLFATNVAMGLLIQTPRLLIMSFDHLAEVASSTDFIKMLLAVTTVSTFSTFFWTEQAAMIDSAKTPAAKNFFRRVAEIRGFGMGWIAPSSRLWQLEKYGYNPYAFATVSGLFGLWTLLRSTDLVNFAERSSWVSTVHKQYTKMDDLINRTVFQARACQALF